MRPTSVKTVRSRLNRIEGQIRGLMQMLEEGRDSKEVLTQLSAVRAALESVGSLVIADHVEELAGNSPDSAELQAVMRDLMRTFLR